MTATEYANDIAEARLSERARIERLILHRIEQLRDEKVTGLALRGLDAKGKIEVLEELLFQIENGYDVVDIPAPPR